MNRATRRIVAAIRFLILILIPLGAVLFWMRTKSPPPPTTFEPPLFVGRETCSPCHSDETARWRGSHHDLAMQVAGEETVLGDFSGVTFTRGEVTSKFYRRDGKFLVHTDGPGGKLDEYEVAYTFGVTPLQQYLIPFSGGRYQVLPLCWDSRPVDQGGQRWFHIYPDEVIDHNDPLHWTGRYQNWNFMCAECHSTDLKRNYDLEKDTYATTWSEIDVSCEACHGPGSNHVRWAEAAERGETLPGVEDLGLAVRLKDVDGGVWHFADPGPDLEEGTAQRKPPRGSHVQVEACGRCHSRHSQILRDYVHGRPLLDTHRVEKLEERLYHPDGQILEEVYVYGSFLQSKMYHRGVTCNDCHDSHSLEVGAGNEPCFRCHLSPKYDTAEHHFHKKEGAGGSCLDCHMPAKTYMVVDPRRDHSIRIPRPDLTIKLGTPNACNQCHTDRTSEWAVEAVRKWYGKKEPAAPHYGEVFHAGRAGEPGALGGLARISADSEQPGIVRASALLLLRNYPGRTAFQVIGRALSDADPMVRAAALNALEIIPLEARPQLACGLLDDPVRGVRIAAVRALAPVPHRLLDRQQNESFRRAFREAVDAALVNADRPEAHLSLGVLYTERGRYREAEASYLTALRLDPHHVEVRINLADLYRIEGRDDEGERVLRQALLDQPDAAVIHHTLGLLLARGGRNEEAIDHLEKAARLDKENPRHIYVYAVALNSRGESERAITELEEAHRRFPNDRDILQALATMCRDAKLIDQAIEYTRKLLALSPEDRGIQQLLEQLRGR